MLNRHDFSERSKKASVSIVCRSREAPACPGRWYACRLKSRSRACKGLVVARAGHSNDIKQIHETADVDYVMVCSIPYIRYAL